MSEGPPAFHEHVSPDGAWRWNGRAWVPAIPLAQPPPATASEPAPWQAPVRSPAPPSGSIPAAGSEVVLPQPARRPAAGAPGQQDERKKRAEAANRFGWITIGALIGASLLVMAAIIAAALLLYRAAGSPPPNVQPTGTPSTRPVDPNSLDYRYLTGITVGGVTASLRGAGFACGAPAPPESNLRDWRCDRTEAGEREIVQIWAVDQTHVHLVDATTVAESGSIDRAATSRFEAEMVAMIYVSSAARGAAAGRWVGTNFDRTASATIGAVRLRTQVTEIATLLEFDAGTRH
ncbi:MAG: hypothetical protein ACREQM_11450 [Candidatus Dormibacteraceae bacterium]